MQCFVNIINCKIDGGFVMNKFFVFILMALLGFTSCTQEVVFNVVMEVTPTEVRNGDEITISFIKSEDTNVDFKAEIFWENEKIGEVSNPLYELKYVVNGVEEGFYKIGSIISSKSQSGTMSSSTTLKTSKTIYVVE